MSKEVDDDDVPQLSTQALLALQDFYEKQNMENNSSFISDKMSECANVVSENWQLSQFWYDDKTVEDLVKIALNCLSKDSKIALISCPTLYKKMKQHFGSCGEVTLFEYDKRFSIYGRDFIFYDYNSPLDISSDKAGFYDLVIADPPFLSEECLTKTASTIKFLAKSKIILCTGAIMENVATDILKVKKTSFQPHHKNNLANEFYCYSNFNFDVKW